MCIGVSFGMWVVVLVEFAEYAPEPSVAVPPAGDEGGAEDPQHGADRDDGGEMVSLERSGVVVRGGRYVVSPDGRRDACPGVRRYGVSGMR
ncbi:hypothetical protein [Actinoallomurus iriomotensis]|uniref:Uncharacterized protein n=1 Tax=Actinoallomurus iriomotensis TaxID=478107 RepID=A0A9W6RPW4_9ACTN|nr:hypothetical protein [Actinoallomurus iriomotensis]GLY77997.1 hypothetical protein Airi01_062640 [Actinoallomurus iriomotensis]